MKADIEEEFSGLNKDPLSLLYLEQFYFYDVSEFNSRTVAHVKIRTKTTPSIVIHQDTLIATLVEQTASGK